MSMVKCNSARGAKILILLTTNKLIVYICLVIGGNVNKGVLLEMSESLVLIARKECGTRMERSEYLQITKRAITPDIRHVFVADAHVW